MRERFYQMYSEYRFHRSELTSAIKRGDKKDIAYWYKYYLISCNELHEIGFTF